MRPKAPGPSSTGKSAQRKDQSADNIGRPKLVARPLGPTLKPLRPLSRKGAPSNVDFSDAGKVMRGELEQQKHPPNATDLPQPSPLPSFARQSAKGKGKGSTQPESQGTGEPIDHAKAPTANPQRPNAPTIANTTQDKRPRPKLRPQPANTLQTGRADHPATPSRTNTPSSDPQKIDHPKIDHPKIDHPKIDASTNIATSLPSVNLNSATVHPTKTDVASKGDARPAFTFPKIKKMVSSSSQPAVARVGVDSDQPVIRATGCTLSALGQIFLSNAHFDVFKGEFLGFAGLGSRACRLLFEAILGEQKPQEGTLATLGQSDGKARRKVRPKTSQQLGWLRLHYGALRQPVWPLLGPEATCLDILTHAARLFGLDHPAATAQRFQDLVGLTGSKPTRHGWELAYRVRVRTALVLIANPSVVLMDFPTRDLGLENARWVWSILEQYQDDTGATLVLASNDLAELERLCDRVVLFDDHGQVVDSGAPNDLVRRMGRENITQVFLDPANLDR